MTAKRAIGALGLLGVAALLALVQWTLSVSDWLRMPPPEPLRNLDASLPQVSRLGFPPGAAGAFLAAAAAVALFGVLVRLVPARPFLLDPAAAAPLPPRGVLRSPVLPLLLALGAVEWLSLRATLAGNPVPPFLWLGSLGLLFLVAATLDRRRGLEARPLREIARSTAPWVGLVALLFAAAALGAPRPALAASCGAVALALLGVPLVLDWPRLGALERAERIGIPLLTLASFLSHRHGLRSWAWSFLGDEFTFFDLGEAVVKGTIPLSDALSPFGAWGLHPRTSAVLDAASMVLFGVDAYGWKAHHALLLALCVPPLYFFLRRLVGPSAAFLGAGLVGFSHVLLSFGKLGSNNAQGLIFLPLGLALVARALESGRLVSFAGTGIVVGLGLFTFGITRVFSIAVAVWLATYLFPLGRAFVARLLPWLFLVGSAVVAALPVIVNQTAWGGQLTHTILRSENAGTWREMGEQLLRNTLWGGLSFLTCRANGVFVYGATADPLTGSLALLGLATLLFARGTVRARFALLSTAVVLVVLLAGMQQYPYPSMTRLFALAPLTALLAAVGFAGAAAIAGGRRAGIGAGALLAFAVPVNLWWAYRLSPSRLPAETAFLLQLVESTSDHLYIVPPPDRWLETLYHVFAIPAGRYQTLPAAEALRADGPCRAPRRPEVFAVPARGVPDAYALATRYKDCWPGSRAVVLKDGAGEPRFFRVSTPDVTFKRIPGYWREEPIEIPALGPPPKGELRLREPRGVAASGDRIAAIDGPSGPILLFDAAGRPTGAVRGSFRGLNAVTFGADGGLILFDVRDQDGLFFFDPDGTLRSRAGYGIPIGEALSLAAVADGMVWVAIPGDRRVLRIDPTNQLAQEARGPFLHPMALAVGTDGHLAVLDTGACSLFVLDRGGELLDQLDAGVIYDPSMGIPGVVWDGVAAWLVSDPVGGRILRLSRDAPAEVVHEGLKRPSFLARLADGRLATIEADAGTLTLLPAPTPSVSDRTP